MDKANIKNEEIEIKATENGFIVKYSYQQKPVDSKDYWDYKNKLYSFNDWASTVKWVEANPVTQPPQ